MKLSQMIVAAAIVTTAGSALAQQTEFTAPDAAFRATASRIEVRQDMTKSYAAGHGGRQQRDGQDQAYTAKRSRQEVRAEVGQSSQSHRGNVDDLYFGA